jgi:hypothetical protein
MNQNFEMYAGDTKYLDYSIIMDGVLAGSTIEWVLFDGAGVLKVTKATSSGITITGDRTFRVTLSPSDTTSLLGVYSHETEVTDASTNVSTVSAGTVLIRKSNI